jgi:hypothetical protein
MLHVCLRNTLAYLTVGESHRLFLDFGTKITQVIGPLYRGNSWINISTSVSISTLRKRKVSERGSDFDLASLTELASVDALCMSDMKFSYWHEDYCFIGRDAV